MRKIISIILLCSLLFVCFSGCSLSNSANGEKKQNHDKVPNVNGGKGNVPAIIEGELDKSSDLVATLVAYLEQYLANYDLIGRTFAQKIDDIKSGTQPLHVAFDPSDYYFVCGYFNSSSEYGDIGYSSCNEYTWVRYKNESDIKEYYNDMKWSVVFQINRALTITDIVSNENNVPNIEHFQIYTPTFENGANIGTPVVFNETFIYLNYPNCYLNRLSNSNNTMYYCIGIYYHTMNTIPCVYLDDDYYLPFYLYTIYSDGERGEEKDYAYSFSQYYDTLMSVIEKDTYSLIDEYYNTSFYGTISVNDFVNRVLK